MVVKRKMVLCSRKMVVCIREIVDLREKSKDIREKQRTSRGNSEEISGKPKTKTEEIIEYRKNNQRNIRKTLLELRKP